MHKLGISIYPENSTPEKDAAYIKAAAQHGFTRVFSCLLSASAPKERVTSEFTALDDLAHENGMEVCLDVAPATFEKLGIGYSDLSFFSGVHADAIRLDEAFDAAAVAEMTRNPQGLSIELNASTCDGTLDAVMRHDPNTDRLMACHNFYPQRFSGLGLERFLASSREVKKYGLELAAFISAPDRTAFGPWPVRNGLCTLECHRGMPLSLQARHLFALGLIDDVMVANCFPSEKDLEDLGSVDPSRIMFHVELEDDPTEVEQAIMLDYPHMVRGDFSDYTARSTQCRITYADAEIAPHNTHDIHPGSVVVVNERSTRYKGELQLALSPMPNDGSKNVVAHLAPQECVLLDFLDSWKHFGFFV